mgnify:CR=1 FL=1
MKELQFIAKRQAEWAAWDRYLDSLRKSRRRRQPEDGETLVLAEISAGFRRLSRDLALARDRQYSAPLIEALHQRVLAAHQSIYGAGKAGGASLFAFIGHDFPRLVRQEWRCMLVAGLLFLLPMLLGIIVLQLYPDAVFYLLSPDQVDQYQQMYSPQAQHLGRPRSADSQWMMWGYYIANNVRIDFQCFAGGIAFGVGAVFFMLYNGLMIGAVAGHLTQMGFVETFWGFVAGHSAFELTGAIISGAAGLKIGHALIAPGRRSRLTALKENAKVAIGLVYGAAAMTFMAAFIEAFWSPIRSVPFSLKIGVGIALIVLTWAYLLLGGRGGRRAA